MARRKYSDLPFLSIDSGDESCEIFVAQKTSPQNFAEQDERTGQKTIVPSQDLLKNGTAREFCAFFRKLGFMISRRIERANETHETLYEIRNPVDGLEIHLAVKSKQEEPSIPGVVTNKIFGLLRQRLALGSAT